MPGGGGLSVNPPTHFSQGSLWHQGGVLSHFPQCSCHGGVIRPSTYHFSRAQSHMVGGRRPFLPLLMPGGCPSTYLLLLGSILHCRGAATRFSLCSECQHSRPGVWWWFTSPVPGFWFSRRRASAGGGSDASLFFLFWDTRVRGVGHHNCSGVSIPSCSDNMGHPCAPGGEL